MTVIVIFHRLERMDQLIRLKATGCPVEFASRLGLSRAMMYHYLDLLRELGGPVRYNKTNASYEYEYPVALQLRYMKR